jgi:hypothetical protein
MLEPQLAHMSITNRPTIRKSVVVKNQCMVRVGRGLPLGTTDNQEIIVRVFSPPSRTLVNARKYVCICCDWGTPKGGGGADLFFLAKSVTDESPGIPSNNRTTTNFIMVGLTRALDTAKSR